MPAGKKYLLMKSVTKHTKALTASVLNGYPPNDGDPVYTHVLVYAERRDTPHTTFHLISQDDIPIMVSVGLAETLEACCSDGKKRPKISNAIRRKRWNTNRESPFKKVRVLAAVALG